MKPSEFKASDFFPLPQNLAASEAIATKSFSFWGEVSLRFKKNRVALIGCFILLF